MKRHSIRHALAIATALTAACAAGQTAESAGECAVDGPLTALSQPIDALKVDRASVDTIVTRLRELHHVRLSFVDAGEEKLASVSAKDGTLKEILDQLVQQTQRYSYAALNGHVVLFPSTDVFRTPVDVDGLSPSGRYNTAAAYVSSIRSKIPALVNWWGPIAAGTSPQHSVFADRVTLRPRGTVIEHLVDLAGEDLVFRVSSRTSFRGLWVLEFFETMGFRKLVVSIPPGALSVGTPVRLRVIGERWAGGSVDLSNASCGTRYAALAPSVVQIDEDGTLLPKQAGRSLIRVSNAGTTATLALEVK